MNIRNVGVMLVVVGVMALFALPAGAAPISASAPTIDFETAIMYTWGIFNNLGPIIWPLFGFSLVPFIIALIWRLKP